MTDAAGQPIILIGAARSGTKFLRDVLATAPDTAHVPYDVNYVWRYGSEAIEHDALDPSDLTEQQIAFIRKSLRSIAKAAPKDTLIEKTVSNTLRVPYVDRVFPNARYVHLLRDGRDVTESAMRLWQKPPDISALLTKLRGMPLSNIGYVFWFAKNFVTGLFSGRKGGGVWGPRFDGIQTIAKTAPLSEVCARQWATSVTTAAADLAALPNAQDRVFTIRYEDLISNEDALRNLIAELKLKDADTVVAHWKRKLSPGQKAQWRNLPDTDQDILKSVLTSELERLGYV